MSTYYCYSNAGATARVNNTAYSSGNKIVIALADTSTNYLVARAWVWECTTGGTSGVGVPSWPATVTQDVTTVSDGTVVWTARKPGYSSGSTVDWTFATIYLLYAYKAAVEDYAIIKVHKTHLEIITAGTTYSPENSNISVICVDKDSSDSIAQMDGSTGYIGNSSSSYSIALGGSSTTQYIYGLAFIFGGFSAAEFRTCQSDNTLNIIDNCKMFFASGSSTGSILTVTGNNYQTVQSIFKNCTFKFGNIAQALNVSNTIFENLVIDSNGTNLTYLINNSNMTSDGDVSFIGCNLSKLTNTLIGDNSNVSRQVLFENCNINPQVTILASQSSALAVGSEVFVINCNTFNNYTNIFGHYNGSGSTEIFTTVYLNNGTEHIDSKNISWKITTTAKASVNIPYKSPWIQKYNKLTTLLTPYLEGLRENSTTVIQNDEVWIEASYLGNSGTSTCIFKDDKVVLLGTPADQTSTKTISDWSGADAGDSTFKLSLDSPIAPTNIGLLKTRVCVGIPSTTIYIDPQIRM